MHSQSELAFEIYRAAVAAAAPAPRVATAVARLPLAQKRAVWLFAMGKAAHAMAAGAVDALTAAMIPVAGGLIVAPEAAPSPNPALEALVGEHPVPGRGSFAASQRLAALATGMRSTDAVIVLVSGGATSLVASPVKGVAEAELADLFARLHTCGLPIAEMNAIRKRFTRWGGGRLAVAVAPASTWCLAVSDVVGNVIETIGSGPCAPDVHTATEVKQMLDRAGLLPQLPASMHAVLDQTPRGLYPETPKPRHPAFAHVHSEIVLTNRDALDGAAASARAAGCVVEIVPEPLTGEASAVGVRIAQALVERRRSLGPGDRACVVWGGEPTVTLAPPPPAHDKRGRPLRPPPSPAPAGGRCQELALAAAQVLHAAGDDAQGVHLLAAGTDGRDGPTDAAGASVDRHTWQAVVDTGGDPAAALAGHDAHGALAAAGGLLRPGPTGTNVMDIVIGLIEG